MATQARQCDNCGTVVTPRGSAAPRFCPTCGQRLADHVSDAPIRTPDMTAGTAIAALVLGILSLVIPVIGLFLGIGAIAAGSNAKRRIEKSRGQLGGRGLATAGITLGIIGTAIWTLVCLGAL